LNENESINLNASQQESMNKLNEEDIFCTVKPEEVPQIPENKFLMRKSIQETENKNPSSKVEDKRF
jgi:hypothetical protein